MVRRILRRLARSTLCVIGLHRWRDSRCMPERVCRRCGWRTLMLR